MTKERDLLQRVVGWWDDDKGVIYNFVEEIRTYLAEPTQDEEPIGYVITIDPSKSYRQDSWAPWKEVEGMNGGKIRDDIPDGSFVYLHPAPHPHPFIRLTDEEIKTLEDSGLSPDWTDEFELYHFARAIEGALEEKNNE